MRISVPVPARPGQRRAPATARPPGRSPAFLAANRARTLLTLQRAAGNRSVVDLVRRLRERSEAVPRTAGLPAGLKAGAETLSGISMDHVEVHYNSPRPAEVGAVAYAQGSQIHVAPGQERHLPHEAWHVVQQAQGRVRPGGDVDDDPRLEQEADVMGAKAVHQAALAPASPSAPPALRVERRATGPIQRIGAYQVKQGLESDQKYWPLYQKWFRVNGAEKAAGLLGPLETVEAVKTMLDGFARTAEAEYSEAQLKRIELEREYGSKDVFRGLVAGIDAQATASVQLEKLLANFKELGPSIFDYTMASTGSDRFLKGTKGGDCNTVVRTFKLIAEDYLGIPVAYKTSKDVGFAGRFTAPQAATIDRKTGNVDDGGFWLFDNHYWIEAGGKQYDVLFGKFGVDTGSWVKEIGKSDNPSLFGEMKIWTTGVVQPIAARYKTAPP
jgi:uncharacterized protein DUF4157